MIPCGRVLLRTANDVGGPLNPLFRGAKPRPEMFNNFQTSLRFFSCLHGRRTVF